MPAEKKGLEALNRYRFRLRLFSFGFQPTHRAEDLALEKPMIRQIEYSEAD